MSAVMVGWGYPQFNQWLVEKWIVSCTKLHSYLKKNDRQSRLNRIPKYIGNSHMCDYSPWGHICSEKMLHNMCYGCNTKSTRYSCYSGNVPGLHISLRVELLTLFTSGLPFLLCSSFVLTLLIRKHRLVVLSFCSLVLRSQTYLRSITPNSLLCSISGYCACCAP